MANSVSITFDENLLSLIEHDGEKFIVTPDVEDKLLLLIEYKERIAEIEDIVKDKLAKVMRQENITKVEGESVKVNRRYYGARYEVSDPQLALQTGVATEEKKTKVDTKAIDQFIEENDTLPEGIKLRDRTERATISKV